MMGSSRLDRFSDSRRFCRKIASFAASVMAIASDSMVDRATQLCLFDPHEIAPLDSMYSQPDVDFESSGSVSNEASQNPMGSESVESGLEYRIPWSRVPLMWRRTCFNAFMCISDGLELNWDCLLDAKARS